MKKGGKTREEQLVALAFHQQRGCLFASGSSRERGTLSASSHGSSISPSVTVYLSLCLSLPVSLSLARSPRVCLLHFFLHSATACHCFSTLNNFLCSLPVSTYHSISVIFLFTFLSTNCLFCHCFSSYYFHSRPHVSLIVSPRNYTVHY